MGIESLQRRLQRTLPMARLETISLPGCSSIRLALIAADFPAGPLPREVMNDVIETPAYWAFCWGSGLALARFLLANPHWVSGRRVVDLGSGSGVAAIAAIQAGAASVCACDTDPDARAASRLNAGINGVDLEVTASPPSNCEMLLMADVLYDKQNLGLLRYAQTRAHQVLVADTRITRLPDASYRELTRLAARTVPNLGEFDEFTTAHIFHWAAARAAHQGSATR